MATQALFRDLKWTAFRWDSVSEWTMGWSLLETPGTGHTARDAIPPRWGGALGELKDSRDAQVRQMTDRKLCMAFGLRGTDTSRGPDYSVGLLGQSSL